MHIHVSLFVVSRSGHPVEDIDIKSMHICVSLFIVSRSGHPVEDNDIFRFVT